MENFSLPELLGLMCGIGITIVIGVVVVRNLMSKYDPTAGDEDVDINIEYKHIEVESPEILRADSSGPSITLENGGFWTKEGTEAEQLIAYLFSIVEEEPTKEYPEGLEIYKDDEGKWRWRIHATNGNIIGASSQGYVRRDMCEYNILSVSKSIMSFAVMNIGQ